VSPRVLIDATAVPADRGGVGRYVDGLVAGLAALDADLAVVGQPADVAHYGRLHPAATVVPGPGAISRRPARLAWEQVGLPAVAARVNAQVVHSPHYTMPVRAGRPVVVTLHDATFFTDPQMHTRVKGAFFRSASRLAVRRAARCVVPSRATRDELVRELGADADGVDVAYHGVDTAVFGVPAEADKERVGRRLGLADHPYLAFLGTLEPRKNVPALVRAWVAAFRGCPDAPALVLAGGAGWDDQIDAAIAAVPASMRLVRAGYLPMEDLPGLLGGAMLVAYPSLGEGFGLPVLEAMACGAPVLTTRRLALPEVGGVAVAYTEPDEPAIAAALRDLVADADRRTRLAAAGRDRAAGFTWEASAAAHLDAYRRAVRS
jgi:glycosyltransferase involved in cell wall biosynthesis